MTTQLKSSLKYMGFVFLAGLILGFIFGPKYLDLTPIWIVVFSVALAFLSGLRDFLEVITAQMFFGRSANKESSDMQHNLDFEVTKDLNVIEPLVERVLLDHPDVREMNKAEKGVENVIYARLVKDHGVMVGNPKIIRKILNKKFGL